jgi:hypothetical protein
VIPMSSEAIKRCIINRPNLSDFDLLDEVQALAPFSDSVLDYLNDLSRLLFKDSRAKNYPDVSTFAFYCRKANLLHLQKTFTNDDEIRLGRGMVFHIAPSNVPVNFAYSLIAGLLSGNSNVVRVPSKKFEQIQIVIDAINVLSELDRHRDVSDRIILIRYDNQEDSITRQLSSICAVRVIWGGDQTIRNIRKHDLSPRSFDLTFSDRYSICVIQADSIVNAENTDALISGFYNDTYLFDQNACTSPHLVVWLGSDKNVAIAQDVFWSGLLALVRKKYSLQTVQSVDKISTFYSQAVEMSDVSLVTREDNLLWRVKLNTLENCVEDHRCNSGYFSEYHASSLGELVSIINPKYQTLAYYGVPKGSLLDFMTLDCPRGIDRLVPIGKTTDFSLNWDGYDLIRSLSRIVEVT